MGKLPILFVGRVVSKGPEWLSLWTFLEGIPKTTIQTGAEMFIFLNHCPQPENYYLFKLNEKILTSESPLSIFLALTSIVKTSKNVAKESSIKTLNNVLKRFSSDKYDNKMKRLHCNM